MPGKRLNDGQKTFVLRLLQYFEREFENGGPLIPLSSLQKLTGYSLERSNKASLDDLFTKLKTFTNTANGTITTLVNSVIILRNSNWGYSSDTAINADSVTDGIYYEGLQNTVFYHSDGHTFTNEENDFLAAHVDSNAEYLSSDNSDPDDLCDPEPEMDEEIQAAFKEFVKFSRR